MRDELAGCYLWVLCSCRGSCIGEDLCWPGGWGTLAQGTVCGLGQALLHIHFQTGTMALSTYNFPSASGAVV